MLPNVAKNAGSIRNFERQSYSPANAYCPRVLARPDFFKSSAGRKFVATQEIGERAFDGCLTMLIQSAVGFAEAR